MAYAVQLPETVRCDKMKATKPAADLHFYHRFGRTVMKPQAIAALRLSRQHLIDPLTSPREYECFARRIQPLTPPADSRPGNPPCLVHRAAFDDAGYLDSLRTDRTLVKGRFQGGNVGYVFADELSLYAAAYRKPLNPDYTLSFLLDLLEREGPLTCHNIKEMTGMLSKEIMPALHKLQESFLVYEDQVDSDWERGWYAFDREFPDVDLNRYSRGDAVMEIVCRSLGLLVFAREEHLRGWLRLPVKEIRKALETLTGNGTVMQAECGDRQGYIRTKDVPLIETLKDAIPAHSVFVIHRSDFLVRAFEPELKERFSGREILQYILIDGEFSGAVCGHWRQGPHDVEDVVLTLPQQETQARKDEILKAVGQFYSPPFSHVLRFNGEEL